MLDKRGAQQQGAAVTQVLVRCKGLRVQSQRVSFGPESLLCREQAGGGCCAGTRPLQRVEGANTTCLFWT